MGRSEENKSLTTAYPTIQDFIDDFTKASFYKITKDAVCAKTIKTKRLVKQRRPIMKKEKLNLFWKCCQEILKIETKPGAMLGYAQAYAEAGLGLSDEDSIRVQVLYILSNLSTWKGEKAREVKAILKGLR